MSKAWMCCPHCNTYFVPVGNTISRCPACGQALHQPAALQGEERWYCVGNRHRQGPYSLADLKQFLAAGRLQRADMVWKEGTQKWIPLQSALQPDSTASLVPRVGGRWPRWRIGRGLLLALAAACLLVGLGGLSLAIFPFGKAGNRMKGHEQAQRVDDEGTVPELSGAEPAKPSSPRPDTPDQDTPKEFEHLVFKKPPTLWKDVTAEISIEGQKLIEQRPIIASEAKKMTSFRAKMEELEIDFTPIPSFVRTIQLPLKHQARFAAIDRVSFIETHMKAKHERDHVYAIQRHRDTKEYAKVTACVVDGDAGTLMIVGMSVEMVQAGFKKLQGYASGEGSK